MQCDVAPLSGVEFCFAYNACAVCKMPDICSRLHKCMRCRGSHASFCCPDNVKEYLVEHSRSGKDPSVGLVGGASSAVIGGASSAQPLSSSSSSSSSFFSSSSNVQNTRRDCAPTTSSPMSSTLKDRLGVRLDERYHDRTADRVPDRRGESNRGSDRVSSVSVMDNTRPRSINDRDDRDYSRQERDLVFSRDQRSSYDPGYSDKIRDRSLDRDSRSRDFVQHGRGAVRRSRSPPLAASRRFYDDRDLERGTARGNSSSSMTGGGGGNIVGNNVDIISAEKRSISSSICRDYNNGTCLLEKCKFLHACMRCGDVDHQERRCQHLLPPSAG